MEQKKGVRNWLILSLILCFISMAGTYVIQSDYNSVDIKDIRVETPLGRQISFLLFVPENASKENPAPAIVTSHGWYNNREMQDLNYVELARRGYVVASIDMYGHGNSDPLPVGEEAVQGTGMYDVVEFMATLPYVDKSEIGVTGHSNGARAANFSVDIDNKRETPLIKSVLLIANDANYVDADKNFYNKYGNRDVGIVAALYDEFFFRVYGEDGSVTAPRDYINQATAQSFLNFGKDPSDSTSVKKDSYIFYKEEVDGREAIRVIFNPNQIHPWNHVSADVVKSTLDFFEMSLPAPKSLASDNQVWQIKLAFNTLGLLGFAMFVTAFTKVMLRTSFFSSLLSKGKVEALPNPGKGGYLWFVASLILSVIFSAVCYVYLFSFTRTLNLTNMPYPFMMQSPVLFIGLWSVLCAVFTLVLVFIGSKIGKAPISLRERGVSIGIGSLLKSLLLAIFVVLCAFGLVFAADIFFKADFRFWVLPLKAFTADKFYPILIYLPFFLVFYIINSLAVNCFNYIKGLPEIVNVILLAIVNGLSSALLIFTQYSRFLQDGRAPFEIMFGTVSFNIIGIWLFPILIYLPLAVFFMRSIFKDTKNPYLGAMIFALIVTIVSCTNTLTYTL